MRTSKVLALVLVGSALGLGVGIAANELMPESPARGLFIGSKPVPRHANLYEFLEPTRAEIADRTIVLRAEGFERSYKFTDLGIDLDLPATVRDAEFVGKEGSILERVKTARAARRGFIDVPLTYHVREGTTEALLESLASDLAIEPVDAKMDLATRSKIGDVPGRKLDVQASLAVIEKADFHDGEVIDLVTTPVRAKVTLDDLISVDITKVVSSFETTFHTWGSGAGRAVNITNAAHFIDGTVVMPGEVFSFNDKVGPRTLERGFTWAPEILADELTTGVGGGTCQASTTLFAAALYASLDIVERRSHSRPSSYTKMGLDATVIYGSQDLKIKNTLPFAIMIHAYLPTPEKIRVELLGGDPVADVTYAFGIGSSSDFLRRITLKPYMQPGSHILHQRGARGYDVTSLVSIKFHDGRSEERTYFSGYRPTPEVFWVGPGYDEHELPPLPEHARGIEGRANEDETYSAL